MEAALAAVAVAHLCSSDPKSAALQSFRSDCVKALKGRRSTADSANAKPESQNTSTLMPRSHPKPFYSLRSSERKPLVGPCRTLKEAPTSLQNPYKPYNSRARPSLNGRVLVDVVGRRRGVDRASEHPAAVAEPPYRYCDGGMLRLGLRV